MKKIIIITIALYFFLFKNTDSFAQTNFPNNISGCIAHWDFALKQEMGDTFILISDVSGNGNDGVPTHVVSDYGFKNSFQEGGKFNGNSSLVHVLDAPLLNPSNITVISLMKFSGFYSGVCQFNNIINKGRDQNYQMSWAFTVSDEAFDSDCYLINSDKQLLNFKTGNSNPYYYPHYTTNYIEEDKWYFLAAVYEGNILKLYIIEFDENIAPNFNSIVPLATVIMGTHLPTNNTDDLYIGFHENPPFPYWVNGIYDELLLYNRALSNTEIIDVAKHFYGDVDTTGGGNNNDTPNSINRLEINPVNVYAFNKTVKIDDPNNVFNKIEIYDIQGRSIIISDKKEINLSHIATQILFTRCYTNNGKVYYKKIAIE